MLLSVSAFEGSAAILGALRRVRYEGGVLQIHDLAGADVNLVLDRLSSTIADNPVTSEVSAGLDRTVVRPISERQGSKPEASPAVPVRSPAPVVVEQKFAPQVSPEKVVEAVVASKPIDTKPPEAKEAPQVAPAGKTEPPEGAPNPGDPVPEASPVGLSTDGIPDEVLNTKQVREVVGYFFEVRGLKTLDEIVAECERIKDRVPALQRVGDMNSRIKRVLELFTPPAVGS
jgi:hypothetical protein